MELDNHPIAIASFFLLFTGAVVLLMGGVSLYSQRLDDKRSAYIRRYAFPASVAHSLKLQYPNITEQVIESVLAQLRLYFLICKKFEGKPVGMPSTLVDSAWHSFILSTQNYRVFCQQAFGWYLHHLPEADGHTADPHELARAFKGAKLLGGSASLIPLFFSIDTASGLIPNPARFTGIQLESALADYENHLRETKSKNEENQGSAACSAAAACGCGGGSC